jgi:hypothetical protein
MDLLVYTPVFEILSLTARESIFASPRGVTFRGCSCSAWFLPHPHQQWTVIFPAQSGGATFALLVFPSRANECGVAKNTMSNYPFILFNKSPEQLRLLS